MADTKTNEMAKAYDPKQVESRWYDWWEAQGYFTPRIDPNKKPFTIIMPPPNVTGELHIGHALVNAVDDILTRYKRQQGYEALYLPGEDHAGIAGQWVVEKEIAKEGHTRHDLGREKFLERAWDYMNRYRPRIRAQYRALGASCDWTRECFTMDPGPMKAVRTVFKRLYDKGLIYKGERIVNWCPRCATTLSDLEVDMVEETSNLWTIRYPLEGEPAQGIEVSTTRPETMLADTGVGVHPGDKRWGHLIGRTVILPIMNRPIPVVADEAVDPDFGTGAVKLTPGHDPLDFEIGQRNGLPIINLLNLDGSLNENAGHYSGQEALIARQGVVEELERGNYLVKVEPYTHNVPRCERCNSVIEPIVSDQWFVSMKPLAEPAIRAVREGRVKIVPERFTRVYFHWMENIRDWPISRQLWWGHRIPIYYCTNGHQFASAEEAVTACEVCGTTGIRQDEDVLDTWFSSGLWPFSTLGWPDETPDLDYFYPGDVMETGYEILFVWVGRMIFQGLEHMGDIPFHTVYLSGIVRDDIGRKMSKTIGNVVDPLIMVDKYGSDALRLSLITNSSAGNDQKFSPQRTEQAGHFANKLWNATRFVLAAAPDDGRWTMDDGTNPRSLANRWITSRYNRTVREITRMLDECQLGEAGKLLQEFVWSDYCDWYIEAAKGAFKSDDPSLREETSRTARGVLDGTLRLLHPYMPFLTEELWQHLYGWPSKDDSLPREERSIMVAPWPIAGPEDEEAERDFSLLIETIREIRNARAEAMRDAPESQRRELTGRRIEALIAGGKRTELIKREAETIANLARLDPAKLTIAENLAPEERPEKAATLVIGGGEVEVVLPFAGLVDLAAERKRLKSEAEAAEAELKRLDGMLANPEFTEKAPAQVVERIRTSRTAAQERLAKLKDRSGAL